MALCSAGTAEAGGFFVREQSTSAQATAFAGAAARGLDPTHMFYNPATIADIDRATLTVDVRGFLPDVSIDASQATNAFTIDVTGRGDSGSMADPALAPGTFAATPIGRDLYLGVGVAAPFAVLIETNPVWAGQFQLLKTEMTGITLESALAWRVAPGIVVSGGVNLQQFEADLRKTELLPFETTGYLTGEDTGVGFTAGVMFEPASGFRLGVGYRSAIDHTLEGKAGVDYPYIPDQSAEFDVTTPQSVTLGLEAAVTDRLTLVGGAQWIDWSVFKGFVIHLGSGGTDVRPQEWRDTWSVSGGARYRLDDAFTVSGGISFDQGVNAGGGTNTLAPDADRIGLAGGLDWVISDHVTAKLSYQHVFFEKAPINVANSSGTLDAEMDNSLDVVGLSLTLRH